VHDEFVNIAKRGDPKFLVRPASMGPPLCSGGYAIGRKP